MTTDATLAVHTIAIEGEFTIYRAAELCDSFKAAFAAAPAGAELQVDLTDVTEMDSAGVQLLIAARKTATESQRELQLIGHSPAVLEVFQTLDLAAHFGAPAAH